jgi:predicted nicotinamide N-methyase
LCNISGILQACSPNSRLANSFATAMQPGYLTQQECIAVAGVDDLHIRSLLDRNQFFDPHLEAQDLGISSATWPLFGMLWPSGAQLAARMALRPVTTERILEIGCGLALASLVAHRRGADVTASDCHPLAGSFLRENIRLNHLPPIKYLHGHWGAPALPLAQTADSPARPPTTASIDGSVEGQFDLIIGSDLLYERDDHGDLARFIALHAAPGAQVWIADPDRGNRAAFNRRMAEHGFTFTEQRMDQDAHGDAPAYKGRLLVYQSSRRTA